MLLAALVLLLAPPADADRAALTAAGVKPDDPAAVLGYLRRRSIGPDDLHRLKTAVAALGADKFADREAASRAVLGFGPAAAALLREAVRHDPDPEVQHRASECLREFEQVPHAGAAVAAVRAAVRLAPAEAAGVLLGFLPAADDRGVAAEVRAALTAVAVRDGGPDPAVLAALTDPLPGRRAAAGVALAEAGKPAAGALPKVLAAAVAEADPDARFALLFALATSARQKDAVGPLVELLPKLVRGRQWQVEDFLMQLADGNGPAGPLGRYAAGDAVDRWLRWWHKQADGFDLPAARYVPRTQGGLLLASMPAPGNGTVAVELGPDGEERWRLPRLRLLADVRPLADGRVQVGERVEAGYRVTVYAPGAARPAEERVFPVKAPNRLDVAFTQAQPLAGGGVLLVGAGEVAEYAPGRDKPVFSYSRLNKLDIAGACRLADGRTLVVVKGGPPNGLFLDPAGVELPDQTLKLAEPKFSPSVAVVAVGADRVLVAEADRLAEYDIRNGQVEWQRPTSYPGAGARAVYCVQRLVNGNTLYVEGGNGPQPARVVEVATDGEEVWAYTSPGSQLQLIKAYQR